MVTMINNHGAHPALRLTPSNSPFFRSTSPRSPTRKGLDEPGLHLRKVIGTTTSSLNGFDCSETSGCFAYTAGAAAVVATVDDNLNISQKFYRARPAQAVNVREAVSSHANSPSPLDTRQRALGTVRESTGSPLSSSVNGRDWSDSPSGKSLTAKDRVKAATSVALSPNGKWLAVGETGHKPRILIFSLAEGSSETPVASLCEHAHGVHSLRFSPDSKYLASLGAVYDGFLYVWTVNDRTGATELFASNKLTTTINSIAWLGRSLITIGLRYIKVWRPDDVLLEKNQETTPIILTPRQKGDSMRVSDFGKSIFSPRHKTLHGKNALLNDLLECNFVAILPISEHSAVICADTGEVCVLDDYERAQSLSLAGAVAFNITSARVHNGYLTLLGPKKQSRSVPLHDLSGQLAAKATRSKRQTISLVQGVIDQEDAIIATGCVGDAIVEFTADRAVTISRQQDQKMIQLPAHRDAVLGVQSLFTPVLPSTRFFTYSGDGTIMFWDHLGILTHSISVPLQNAPESQYQPTNELRSAIATSCGHYILAGDRYGILMLINIESRSTVAQIRAHSAEITHIHTGTIRGSELVATSSRDRLVQLCLRKGESFELLQTLDEHAAVVNGVMIDSDGERLISYSSDRTVVVRDAMFSNYDNSPRPLVFSISRTIAVKSSPTAISISHDNQLFVSSTDRCIARYSLRDGQSELTFKCTDNDGGEAVVMSKLLYLPSLNGTPCIAGVCSADKSVRLYTDYGQLMARDWGHTEGVTDIAVFQAGSDTSRDDIVTVAADSTMFIWSTESSRTRANTMNGTIEHNETQTETRLGPPMRRVISHAELSRFSRRQSTDESKSSSPSESNGKTSTSPQQTLRKKTSRMSIAQPPRLEPSDLSRRRGSRQRSPSPPSPRSINRKRESMRRKSMATLRTKSAESVVKDIPTLPFSQSLSNTGTLVTSTDSICRSLRSWRKRLTTIPDGMMPDDCLRDMEKEMRMTMKAIAEQLESKTTDGNASANSSAHSATESKSSFGLSSTKHSLSRSGKRRDSESDSVVGAMEAVSLNGK